MKHNMPFLPNGRERQMLEAIAGCLTQTKDGFNHFDPIVFAHHLRSLAKTESLGMSSMPEVSFSPAQVEAIKNFIDMRGTVGLRNWLDSHTIDQP